MTTQQLIETYQLNFFNAVEQITNNPKKFSKRLHTFNKFLTYYLFEWRDVSQINLDLLPDLQLVLSEEVEKFDDSSTFTFIIASNTETKIYGDNSSFPDVIIPTRDFYNIIVLWRDFLNEPPLNGTLVDGVPSA